MNLVWAVGDSQRSAMRPHSGEWSVVGNADGPDELFRFSLFVVDGRVDVTNGRAWGVDGFEYVRVITAAETQVLWNAPDQTFVLIGDLPPDHLEEVLADLPRPGQRNWFARVWRRLFG